MAKEGHSGKWSSVCAREGVIAARCLQLLSAAPAANASGKHWQLTATLILILLGFNQAFL